MRALAHPVRMALIELFGASRTTTLTATQASEALGESPANCAFHLRTLAKYGFVEEAGGGRGRERPWRPVANGMSLDSSHLEDPQARTAAEALGLLWLDRVLGRIRRVLGGRTWPAEWDDAVDSIMSTSFLTPEETRQVAGEILQILDRYMDRRDDPSRIPAGALPVEFDVFAYPLPDLAGLVRNPGEPGRDDGETSE
jgi:hypothetical protein